MITYWKNLSPWRRHWLKVAIPAGLLAGTIGGVSLGFLFAGNLSGILGLIVASLMVLFIVVGDELNKME